MTLDIKTISISLLAIWIGLVGLQSFKIISFGVQALPKSWLFYWVMVFIGMLTLERFKLISTSSGSFIYPFLLTYSVVFLSAAIFNWYKLVPNLNMFEHLAGGVLVASILNEALKHIGLYSSISQPLIQGLIFFGIFTALGVLNEVVELFFDMAFKTKNIGPSLWDTNVDLLMNWLGLTLFYAAKIILHF